MIADPPRFADAAARAREAAARYPYDAEAAFVLGMMLPFADQMDESRAAAHRALELDPQFATVMVHLGFWAYQMQKFDEASAEYDRCLALSPTASTCLLRRANMHEARGECAAFEADARRLTQMEPKLPRGHEYLARALAAQGAPVESVRAALDRMVETGADLSPNYSRSFERFSLAMLVGDLTAAAAAARDGDRELAAHPDEVLHANIAGTLSKIAREMGDEAEARHIPEEFERRSAAWTHDAPDALRMWRLIDQHRAGKTSDAEFEERRDTLYRETMARRSPPAGSIDADWIWLHHYTWDTDSPAEVADAMAHIKVRGPGVDEWGELGLVYVRAKEYALAIPSLRRSTRRCTVMPESVWLFTASTRWYLRTNLFLGEALEATGDKAGACVAYGVVTERWKNAKPRSVTLEEARARAKALGCAK